MSLGHIILILVIYVLAVARVTRLVNFDAVLDRLRLWIGRRAVVAQGAADEASAAGQMVLAASAGKRAARWNTVTYFLGCPWCVGFWVSLAGAPFAVGIIGWQWGCVVPVALAGSQLVGMLAGLSVDETVEIVADEG